MLRLRELVFASLVLCLASPSAAQEAPKWEVPLQGVESVVFGDATNLGVLIITPVDDEASGRVEALLEQYIVASGLAEVVMDDSPLGDLSTRSDDEIFEMARKYPVDVIVVLRTFPGADGPTAVMRIETTATANQSFRFRAGAPPPWKRSLPSKAAEDPNAAATAFAERTSRERALMTRMGAVAVVETARLILAEQARRVLVLEADPKSPVVKDPDGKVVPWPKPYEVMGHPDLAKRYRARRAIKTATMASGGVLAAAGIGMLFVGLTNQANCANGGRCGRPLLIGGGLLSLGLGAVSLLTGALIDRHPVPPQQVQDFVDRHNESLQ